MPYLFYYEKPKHILVAKFEKDLDVIQNNLSDTLYTHKTRGSQHRGEAPSAGDTWNCRWGPELCLVRASDIKRYYLSTLSLFYFVFLTIEQEVLG